MCIRDRGTDDTDAVNVKQLKDTVASQTLTYRANTAADTDAKSVKLSKGLDFVDGTMTKATVDNDGKVTFDTVSYTHLDVYKRQAWNVVANNGTAEKVQGGDTVKFIDGDNVSITQNGKEFTVATKKDVTFDNVTANQKITAPEVSGLTNTT